jgi:hypothetical protein
MVTQIIIADRTRVGKRPDVAEGGEIIAIKDLI